MQDATRLSSPASAIDTILNNITPRINVNDPCAPRIFHKSAIFPATRCPVCPLCPAAHGRKVNLFNSTIEGVTHQEDQVGYCQTHLSFSEQVGIISQLGLVGYCSTCPAFLPFEQVASRELRAERNAAHHARAIGAANVARPPN